MRISIRAEDTGEQRLIDRCVRLATDFQRAAEVGNFHMQRVLRGMYERAVGELGYDPLAPRHPLRQRPERPAPELDESWRAAFAPQLPKRPEATREMLCRRCNGPIMKGEWYLSGPRGPVGCPGCSSR
jgi:hypothetical protein